MDVQLATKRQKRVDVSHIDAVAPVSVVREAVFRDHDVTCCWIQQGVLPEKLKQQLTMAEMRRLLPAEREKVRMFGRLVDMPRYSQNYGHSYTYSGVVHHAKPMPEVLQPVLTWINQELTPTILQDSKEEGPRKTTLYDALLVNWYCDRTQYISEHADDEKDLVPGAPIISISLGEERVFRIRTPKDKSQPKVADGSRKRKMSEQQRRPMCDIVMKDGTWLIMGGNFQQHFTHQVPKGSVAAGAPVLGLRVNLTARQYK